MGAGNRRPEGNSGRSCRKRITPGRLAARGYQESNYKAGLLGVANGPGFPDDGDLDLARIGHLALDLF